MDTILFDIDGTLVQSEPADSQCFAQAFQRVFESPAPSTDWAHYAHVTDWGIIDQALGQMRARSSTQVERDTFENAYRDCWVQRFQQQPNSCREVPGAAALIAEIAENPRLKHGIATGGTRAAAAFKLSATGIAPNGLPGAYANGAIPRAAITRNALRALDARPEETVYIGDGLWDINTCRALRMRFVGVAAECTPEQLRQGGATQVVPHFLDRDAFWNAVAAATPPR